MEELEILVPREVRLEMYKELLRKLTKKEITPASEYGLFLCNNLEGMVVEYIEDNYGPYEHSSLAKYSVLEIFPELLPHKPKYIIYSDKVPTSDHGAWFTSYDYKGRKRLLKKVIAALKKQVENESN